MSQKHLSTAELESLVVSQQLLRRTWDPGRETGPFVITGRPSEWDEAYEAVLDHGGKVLGFNDRFFHKRRLLYRLKPVFPGRWDFRPSVQWLFAGRPRKRFFDGASRAINRCLWQVPLTGWRQRGRRDADYLKKYGSELAEVLSILHDSHSQQTYASLIRGRLEGDAGFFRVAGYPEYGHPVVRARPGDIVVDAGAYRGDSALRFAWQMFGRGKILSFEPESKNFDELTRRRIPGLIPVPLGVWHCDDVLSFAGEEGSGRVVEGGDASIKVSTIDRTVANEGLPRVDLLKLDVEGAEKQALDGARETISRHRPKLQISIYHRLDDLFALPLRLITQLPDYRWYLGHHGPWHTETDLYGVPIERL